MPVDGLARRPRIAPVLGAALVAALLPAAGCGPTQEESQWEPVQSYIDLDTAWHAGMNEIGRSDADAQEKARRREAVGEHPDITEAVAAAKTILDAPDHPRFGEAAEFLATHPRGMYEDADQDMARGAAALATHIGPDYSQVEAFIEEEAAWQAGSTRWTNRKPAKRRSPGRRPCCPMNGRRQCAPSPPLPPSSPPAGPDQARAAEFLVAPGSRQAFIDVGYVVRGARFMLCQRAGLRRLAWADPADRQAGRVRSEHGCRCVPGRDGRVRGAGRSRHRPLHFRHPADAPARLRQHGARRCRADARARRGHGNRFEWRCRGRTVRRADGTQRRRVGIGRRHLRPGRGRTALQNSPHRGGRHGAGSLRRPSRRRAGVARGLCRQDHAGGLLGPLGAGPASGRCRICARSTRSSRRTVSNCCR